MNNLVEINYKDGTVSSRKIYEFLFEGKEKKTAYNVWFTRTAKRYGFDEGKDFQSFLIESTGGRPKKDSAVTIDMAKELSMVVPTAKGKQVRQYFIKCENQLKSIYDKERITRLAAKETRKTLTDIVQDSGENERMHGHGYSTYTLMVYSIVGLKDKYNKYKADKTETPFRDYITTEELERVELAESLVKPLLKLEKQYGEIKDTLKPLFEVKEIN